MDQSVSVGVLDHYNIRTRKFPETVHFYEDILGLENGARPNFSFPGAWMYSEGKPVVHLVDISPTSEPQKPDSGVVHHVAFVSRGFAAMKTRLSSKGVVFDTVEVPGGALWQIFITDPNGVVVELNYDAAREAG
jgi:catechol 2,3-dioxygenase-like lactoylglutathione lyase family enzyme